MVGGQASLAKRYELKIDLYEPCQPLGSALRYASGFAPIISRRIYMSYTPEKAALFSRVNRASGLDLDISFTSKLYDAFRTAYLQMLQNPKITRVSILDLVVILRKDDEFILKIHRKLEPTLLAGIKNKESDIAVL